MSLENLFETLSITERSSGSPPISQSVSSSNQNPKINKMTEFKPEYLNCIPQFNGNSNELNRFLSICDDFIKTFYDAKNPQNFQNTYLLNSLLNKLTGNAKTIVNIQSVTTWKEIKDILQLNFGDQRDESILNMNLCKLRQRNNESPQDFYNRCLDALNSLYCFLDSNEPNADTIKIKKDLYKNHALTTFTSGLKEPLGTTIRCMRPADLSAALKIVLQENNAHQFQYSASPRFNHPVHKNYQQNYNPQNSYRNFNPNNSFQSNQQQGNRFPPQSHNTQPRFNSRPQKFSNNSQVFNRQSKPNENVFKPNPNRTFPAPTPMSVSTRQTRYHQSPMYHGPSTSRGQGNPISEEFYNTEVNELSPYLNENTEHGENLEFYPNSNENFQEEPRNN